MPRSGDHDPPIAPGDLMIFIGATGVGLALLRPYLANFAGATWRYAFSAMRTIEITYGLWSIIAACWMVALLVVRYRRSRPRRARLARRPGHVACVAAVVALGMGGLDELTQLVTPHHVEIPFSFYQVWIKLSVRVGPTVAGAWLLLALSGRWRADRGWMDRLGRLLGACWIGWILLWMLPDSIRALIPPIWKGVFP